MTSQGNKLQINDDSIDDFEFFDADNDLENLDDSPKSPVPEAVKKLSSGVGLIFSALCTISEEQGFTVKLPMKSVAATAATALTGTLIGGVPGMALGIITGALLSYRKPVKVSKTSDESKGNKLNLRQVFGQMSSQQKRALIEQLMMCLHKPNVKQVAREICKNNEIRGVAMKILSDFLLQSMGLNFVRS